MNVCVCVNFFIEIYLWGQRELSWYRFEFTVQNPHKKSCMVVWIYNLVLGRQRWWIPEACCSTNLACLVDQDSCNKR